MLRFCGIIPIVLALLFSLTVQAQQDEILFLRMERNAQGVRLLDSSTRVGALKPQLQHGPLEFDVIDSSGEIVHHGSTMDPRSERIEFPDPDSNDQLRSIVNESERAEFTIRVPAGRSRNIRFFERRRSGPDLTAAATRDLISELQLPAEESRLRAAALTGVPYTIASNGPPAERINIVFLAEGYRASQESAFTNQARVVLNQMMNVSPYKEYKGHFNAFAIFVPSAQSGSDHPSRNVYRNTYFNSSYGTGALERLITIPPNAWNSNFADGRGKVFELLAEYFPQYDMPVMLVNDTEYGGSGGVPAIASANALSGELALHEIGHSFAGLADEYEENLSGYPDIEAANTTKETRREFIKWNKWIEPEIPVPTPETAFYQNTIGLFEGAYFHSSDWYRPKMDCRMRNLSKPFCEVCRETHIQTIYSLVEPFQSSNPGANNVTVPGGGELELRVETITPAQGTISFTWTVDGITNASFTSNVFASSYATIGTGSHLVRVNVWDPTEFVRNDPRGLLSKSRSWYVTVVAPTNVPPTISEISDVIMELPQQSSGSAGFGVNDPDTPWYDLHFRVSSSNTNLLGESGLKVVGSGFGRAVEISPEPGQTGMSTVTLCVSDGTTEMERQFDVFVTNIDSDLVLQPISDQRVFSGPFEIPLVITRTSTNALEFFLGSSDSSILAESSIEILSLDGQWKVRFSPEAGVTGDTTVTIAVTDGMETEATSFNLNFLPRPTVTSAIPRMQEGSVLLEFNSDLPAAMILEFSADLLFWTPVSSTAESTKLEFTASPTGQGVIGFYRVRVLPL